MSEEEKELEGDSQNPQEEEKPQETPKEETPEKPEDPPSDKGDSTPKYTEREKQLFERAKKAEAKAKMLEHLEKKVEKSPEIPVEDIAKTVHALKDYSTEEVETIFKHSKALGVSPLEALKDEDVGLLIKAKREKVEKESKTPTPTNRQSTEEKPYSEWTLDDINKSDLDSLSKYYDHLKKLE